MTGQGFPDDDPRRLRAARDDPHERPKGLDPISGAIHWLNDLDGRRCAFGRAGHWLLKAPDYEVRAIGDLILDNAAAGRWDELLKDLGLTKPRGGVTPAVAEAIDERNRLIRHLRRTIPEAKTAQTDAAAARAVHKALVDYETNAWPRHKTRRSAPAEPVAALSWRIMHLPISTPIPAEGTIRKVLAERREV